MGANRTGPFLCVTESYAGSAWLAAPPPDPDVPAMIDAKALLERFLGQAAGQQQPGRPPSGPWSASRSPAVPPSQAGIPVELGDAARKVLGRMGNVGGVGGVVSAAAAGGLLAAVLGGKARKRGGVLSHGGAAVLGALAQRAWDTWQSSRQATSGSAPTPFPIASSSVATPAAFAPPAFGAPPPARPDAATLHPRIVPGATPAAGGEAFELSLIRAMIGAAGADGHIDDAERARIFEHVERAGLDAEAKAFVFDTLGKPVGISEVAAAAHTPEQAVEIYLVSRLAMEPDQPSERAYLQALAHRLRLPPDLVAHLDREADAASAG